MPRGLSWLIGVLLVCSAVRPVGADEDAAPTLDETERSGRALPAAQFADEPVVPFDPLVPPPADVEAQRAARAWFMAGKVHESRSEFNNDELLLAADAFRHAVELDPRAMRAYEALIPVLYASRQKEEARSYALRAATYDQHGLRIVRGLAAVFASGDSLQDSIALLRDAIAQPDFPADQLAGLLVHRDLGVFLHRADQPVEAAKSYQTVFEALQSDDEVALSEAERKELLGSKPWETYDEFGKTFLDAKLPDLAVKAFDEAAKLSSGSPAVHSFNLALVFRDTDRNEEALAELDKYFAAQLQTKGRAAYQLLKDLLADLDRSDELMPKLESLHSEDQRNSFLAYFLADEYIARGNVDQAQKLFEKTLGASNDPRGLVGLMPVYRQQRRGRELIKVLGKIFPQIPEDRSPEQLQKLPPEARELVDRYEQELAALSEDSDAIEVLMEAGHELKGEDPPDLNIAEAYMLGKLAIAADRIDDVRIFYPLTISMLNRPTFAIYREYGSYLSEKKEYAEAVDVFQEAAEHPAMEPVRWLSLYLLSYPLEHLGKTDEALAAITEARGSQPEILLLHFQQAWINYHAERWDAAEPLLREIIDEHKGNPENEDIVRNSQFSLSNLYVQRGEVERGEKVLEEVLKEAPENSQANNDLGYLWADKNKNLDQARTMIEKALKEEPENPAYLDSMGWVLFRLGDFEGAREYLNKAVAQPGGDDSTIYDHLGDVLDKLDLKDEANAAWQKAVELERAKARPDDELLKRVEAKLPEASADEQPPAAGDPSSTTSPEGS